MYPLLVLLVWYAILIAVLASRSSSKEIIAAGAPGFDLLVFLTLLIMGGTLLASPNSLCLAPFFVAIFFFIAPVLLARLVVYSYVSVEKWFQTIRRKRKAYQTAQSVEAIVEAASYRLGDDGEIVNLEQAMQQITHTKDAQKRL